MTCWPWINWTRGQMEGYLTLGSSKGNYNTEKQMRISY